MPLESCDDDDTTQNMGGYIVQLCKTGRKKSTLVLLSLALQTTHCRDGTLRLLEPGFGLLGLGHRQRKIGLVGGG